MNKSEVITVHLKRQSHDIFNLWLFPQTPPLGNWFSPWSVLQKLEFEMDSPKQNCPEVTPQLFSVRLMWLRKYSTPSALIWSDLKSFNINDIAYDITESWRCQQHSWVMSWRRHGQRWAGKSQSNEGFRSLVFSCCTQPCVYIYSYGCTVNKQIQRKLTIPHGCWRSSLKM